MRRNGAHAPFLAKVKAGCPQARGPCAGAGEQGAGDTLLGGQDGISEGEEVETGRPLSRSGRRLPGRGALGRVACPWPVTRGRAQTRGKERREELGRRQAPRGQGPIAGQGRAGPGRGEAGEAARAPPERGCLPQPAAPGPLACLTRAGPPPLPCSEARSLLP